MLWYKLVGKVVVPATQREYVAWAVAAKAPVHVGLEMVAGFRISTVFLGIDHRFGGDGPPIVFETMIFDGDGDNYTFENFQERCCTWDEAEIQHRAAVEHVRSQAAEAQAMLIGAPHVTGEQGS